MCCRHSSVLYLHSGHCIPFTDNKIMEVGNGVRLWADVFTLKALDCLRFES